MRQNRKVKSKTKALALEWRLPIALISLKLFTYWAFTMGDWILKFR